MQTGDVYAINLAKVWPKVDRALKKKYAVLDRLLSQTRAVPVLFVYARDVRDQIVEVVRALGIPPNVRDRHVHFVRCVGCDQIYWRGSHVDRILAELSTVVAA